MYIYIIYKQNLFKFILVNIIYVLLFDQKMDDLYNKLCTQLAIYYLKAKIQFFILIYFITALLRVYDLESKSSVLKKNISINTVKIFDIQFTKKRKHTNDSQ